MKDMEEDKDYQSIHEEYQAVANELPPQSLDASILQAAHQAVESGKQQATENKTSDALDKRRRKKRQSGIDTQSVKRAWYVPVSYVAMLVVSLSVVMKLALEPEMAPMMSDSIMYENDLLEVEQENYAGETLRDESVVNPVVSLSAPASFAEAPNTARALVKRKVTKKAKPVSITAQKELARKPKVQKLEQRMQLVEDERAKIRSSKQAEMKLSSSQDAELTSAPSEMNAYSGSVTGINADSRRLEKNVRVGVSQAGMAEELAEVMVSPDVTEKQQDLIDKLLLLFEKKQYEKLKIYLVEYRQLYPRDEKNKILPDELLDWEVKNINK